MDHCQTLFWPFLHKMVWKCPYNVSISTRVKLLVLAVLYYFNVSYFLLNFQPLTCSVHNYSSQNKNSPEWKNNISKQKSYTIYLTSDVNRLETFPSFVHMLHSNGNFYRSGSTYNRLFPTVLIIARSGREIDASRERN